MLVRRLMGSMAALGSAALLLGMFVASAAPAVAAGTPKPPKPPALCSLVSHADYAAAIANPVPFVFGRVTTGTKALTAFAKQNDLAMTQVVEKASKVTSCFTGILRPGGPAGASGPVRVAGPPSGPPAGAMNLTFFNNLTRKTFLAEKRNFQIESGSVPGSTGINHYVVADVPGIGDAAFTLGVQPAPGPGDLPSYDLFVLVGSSQAHISVLGATPDPAKAQAFANTLVTALRKHGST
jgi:hypothetical protein